MYTSDNALGLFADARAASPWGSGRVRRNPVADSKPVLAPGLDGLDDPSRG